MYYNRMSSSLEHKRTRREAHPSDDRAFTLVELLVVISIISLLIAILLPALGNARKSAQLTGSLSNVRQITLAHHLYANDSDGSLMLENFRTTLGPPWNVTGNFPVWSNMLRQREYLSTMKVFWSGARDTTGLTLDRSPYDGGMTYGDPWQYVGYAMNVYITTRQQDLFRHPLNLNKYVGSGAASTPKLDQSLLLVESSYENVSLPLARNGYYRMVPGAAGFQLFTYKKAVVRSYADGHGNAMPAADIGWTPINDFQGTWRAGSANAYWSNPPWYRNWEVP